MPLRFEHPEWLWVALAAAPMAFLALRWFLTMSRVRRWSAVMARALLLAALASLLAGAVSVRRTDRLAVVAVIDVSDSVRLFASGPDDARPDILPALRDFLAEASDQRGPDDLLGVVAFDRRALAIATPSRADPLTRPIDVRMAEGTDIEAALRYASAMIPADAAGRIVLLSDGNETAGDATAAAEELVSRFAADSGGRSGLPIDVVPLDYQVRDEVMVESVDVPPTADAESVIPVRVVLRSAGSAEGVLRLTGDGRELDINGDAPGTGRALRLSEGRQVQVAEVRLEPGRVHRFDAVWEPRPERAGARFSGDTRVENNRASGLTITPGQGEVLIVDGVNQASPTGGAATLAHTLESAGLGVSMIAPSAFPDDLVSLQAYDLIILQDVPADELSRRAQQSLAAHVQELGAGLVMLGGHNSFGAGGWRGSPVEPLLPVDMEIPDEMVIPTAAVMIVLDASGSMGHSVMGSLANKQQIANESAAMAVATLDKRDLVGVIAFDNFTREVVALAPNTDPDATADRIRGISPGGGTVIGPALDRAQGSLVGVDAELKHVILLSDGQAADADRLPAMAEELGRMGVRVTTISVGAGADLGTMEQIAQRSGGKHYAVMNPNVLPRVFLKAIRIVRTPMVRESPFIPRVLATGSTLIEPLAETPGMPALGGLTLTQARDEPTITTAMVTSKGEPVLAHWQVGLGQVAAFTSDARSDAWASMWARWPGYARFWTSLVRTLSRPTDAGPYILRLEPQGDDLVLRLEATDEQGKPIDYLSAPASVYAEQGEGREVRLAQVAPGLYEARVRGVDPGQVVAVVRPKLGDQALPPVVGGTTITGGAEFRSLRSDDRLLQGLAEATGGRVLDLARPDLAALFDRASVPPRVTATPVFLPLMLLALGLFVLDVATRRVAWDRFVSREFGVDLRHAAAEATRQRGEQAERALAGLRSRAKPTPDARAGGAPSPGGGPLDDDAARRLIAEARQRRQQEESERLRKLREQMLGQAQPATAPDERGPQAEHQAEPGAEAGTGGLLAAKRRARERYDQDKEQGQ